MPEIKPSRLTPVPASDSGDATSVELRDLSAYPDLLILLQEIKNKSRLTPQDYHMVFAELKARLPGLAISKFDEEIEFLSTLFNTIFTDRDLPESIKAQLARLQINLLISIMQESGFLNHSSNPARQLLDTVVKTEVELMKSGNSDHSGIEVLKQGIDRISNCEVVGFDSYQKLLEQYRTETETWPDSEDSRRNSDKTLEVTKITQIVLSMMQEFTIPLQVQNRSTILFDKVWTPLLLQIALTDGLNSSSWIKSVQTVKTQVWALTPKTTVQDHQKLLTMTPQVSKSLIRSMNTLKLSAKLQTSLNEYLKLEQAEVIRNTEHNIESLEQNPETKGQAGQPNSDSNITIDETDDSSTATNAEASPPVDDTRVTPKDEPEKQPQDDTSISEADKFKLGDWIEIKQEDSVVLAKLIWRAEDSSLFIFVDNEGNRVREVDGATLDYEITTGQITVTSTESKAPQKSRLSFFNTLKS